MTESSMATDYSVLCSICSYKVPTIVSSPNFKLFNKDLQFVAVVLAIGEVFISLENLRHAPGIAYPMDSLWEENPELKVIFILFIILTVQLFFIGFDIINTVLFLLALCFRSSWLVLCVFGIYGCDALYQFVWFLIYAAVGFFPGTFGE